MGKKRHAEDKDESKEVEVDTKVLDGNSVTEYVGYAFSDTSFVYPMTKESYFGENVTNWASKKETNLFGEVGQVAKITTRPGAVSVVHGALKTGSRVTVYTASQGLRFMIPNMYKIVAEKVPCVFHVSSRGIAPDLQLFSEHSDVVNARETGFIILNSTTVQECHDMSLVAHMLAEQSRCAVLHFFDGVRTANEMTVVRTLPYSYMTQIVTGEAGEQEAKKSKLDTDVVGAESVCSVFDSLASVLNTSYKPFEYIGHAKATIVLICFGVAVPLCRKIVETRAKQGEKIGLIQVRLLRPWSDELFAQTLPSSTKIVAVLEQCKDLSSPLFHDVSASLHSGEWKTTAPLIVAGNILVSTVYPNMVISVIEYLNSTNTPKAFNIDTTNLSIGENKVPVGEIVTFCTAATVQCVFWDSDALNSYNTHKVATRILGLNGKKRFHVENYSSYDSYKAGGVTSTQLRFGPDPIEAPYVGQQADYIACHDINVFSEFNILDKMKDEDGIFLLNTSWTLDEVEKELTDQTKTKLAKKKIQFYIIDAKKMAENLDLGSFLDPILLSCFFALAVPNGVNFLKEAISATSTIGLHDNNKVLDRCMHPNVLNFVSIYQTVAGLVRVPVPEEWAKTETSDAMAVDLPEEVEGHLIVNRSGSVSSDLSQHKSIKTHSATWRLMFPEAYGTNQKNRPDVKGGYRVRVTKNFRLTPLDYDRNIFHMEFETPDGFNYGVGDALGVHGHNDEKMVNQFMKFYGVHAQDVIELHHSKLGPGIKDTRSVGQLFTQNLDLFGRPSRRFYQMLAPYAENEEERKRLEYLASNAGAEEYKTRVEDTVTFADILQEFPSAHPPVEQLPELIPQIKPRHYSIASSSSLCPNSVHLLVVLVEWENSKGVKRFGQCSHYLADLKTDDWITVSIKSSPMKLPPDPSIPVVMAGLGTGMAPFRAFIQERAYLKSTGVKVGPMMLYFGSRHRSQEYLYGEELEAYAADGLLTRLRLAFSRDQKKKLYIQHKIAEDSLVMWNMIMKNDGYFYLCGPTWPAGDVRDAIKNSFTTHGGMKDHEADETIESLKEDERYVLEVY
eukprot:Lithocolla_globosa_v1_NODE_454_length_4000_cov_50.809886.p1 type:complete len:1068 gc:universal NODE_454_length_4000_cov_50.809886:661-3864(+)